MTPDRAARGDSRAGRDPCKPGPSRTRTDRSDYGSEGAGGLPSLHLTANVDVPPSGVEAGGIHHWLLPPDLRVAKRLCAAGPVTFMTIAPELPGGFEPLAFLVERGVTVALGHTHADAATAHTAYNRGARALTHLHNAQRRFTSRDPGVSAVALTRSDVTVGLIADFVHLAPETVLLAWLAAPGRASRWSLTRSPRRRPLPPMSFTLGDRMIHISDAARLDHGTLAGRVLTMAQAIGNVVSLGACHR